MIITWWMIPIGGAIGCLTYVSYRVVVGIKNGVFSKEVVESKEKVAKTKEQFIQKKPKVEQAQTKTTFKEIWESDPWADMEIKTINHDKFPPPETDKREAIELYKSVPSILFFLLSATCILGLVGYFITGIIMGFEYDILLIRIFLYMFFFPLLILFLFVFSVDMLVLLGIVWIFESLVLLCLGLSRDDIPYSDKWFS